MFDRLRRGLARLLLGPELTRLDEVAGHYVELRDDLERRVGPTEQAVVVLGGDLQREGGARAELQAHLETRIDGLQGHCDARLDQMGAELTDLRTGLADARRDLTAAEGRLARQDEEVAASLRAVQGEAERLRDVRVPEVDERLSKLQTDLDGLKDGRVSQTERDLGALQTGLNALLGEVEVVRDRRLPQLERGVEQLHLDSAAVLALAEEVRDSRLPALSGRVDALCAALHQELTTTSSLVDRLIGGEPLRIEVSSPQEAEIPAAIQRAWATFAESFRGAREEISARAAEYVPILADAAPVLDLGCGRGELLEVLREQGIEARGIDSDEAMVQSCMRLGLAARVGDALDELRAAPAGSLGAVTALHLAEHLGTAGWMGLVDLAARALRRGGVLLVECPNPETLRVGADLFWVDPTHRVPVHPEALSFVARAVGLRVEEVRRLRPFPPEQKLATPGQDGQVRALAERLDAWLSGPRDFLLVARKPLT